MVDNNDYSCYPGAIKWGMFGAGTKHNGNGDNRFAILIQGSKGTNAFERGQYKGHNEQKKNDKESSIANYWIYILIIIVIIILMIILYY